MFPSYMIGPDFKGPIATSEATKDIFGTAFLAHSSALLAEIADILGNATEAEEYRNYAQTVKRAFEEAYWQNGRLTSDLQGCYVIAVAFGLLSGTAVQQAVKRLVELIEANGKRLDTGFLAGPYLLDVLVDGRFVQAEHDISLRFRGSRNQRLLNVPKSLAAGQPVWWEDEKVFATHTMER